MPTQIAERKAIYRKIRSLSDSDAARVMEFIDSISEFELNSDPFYSKSNMSHLRAVKSDAQAGLNMSAHDLIEADDD
jgi:hypothetical protein